MSNAVEPTRENNQPEGHDQFTVADMANQNAKFYNSRPDADEALEKAKDAPGVDPKLFPPGDSPEWMYHDADGETLMGVDECVHCGADIDDGWCPECDGEKGGKDWTPGDEGTPAAKAAEPIVETQPDDLPERNVGDDPLTWMPGHFIDQIDGTPAINRKGFEVLAHHYDISTTSTLEVPPEETGHEYVRVKATATTADGRTCDAYGSAHVDRGDDAELLLELADTRARKRALSIATGVGVVAVEELRNEVDV